MREIFTLPFDVRGEALFDTVNVDSLYVDVSLRSVIYLILFMILPPTRGDETMVVEFWRIFLKTHVKLMVNNSKCPLNSKFLIVYSFCIVGEKDGISDAKLQELLDKKPFVVFDFWALRQLLWSFLVGNCRKLFILQP